MSRIRRSDLSRPGITRVRHGRGWSYHAPNGRILRDAELRERIEQLAIPPAWVDVWICPSERGHIQAVGTDSEGRRQYIYLPAWTARRQARKWDHVERFGAALPAVRDEVDELLAADPGAVASADAAIAWAIRLLDNALLRVGSVEYQRRNGTYGLCTLQRRHVEVDGEQLTIRFTGKHGRTHDVRLLDARLAREAAAVLEGRGRTAPLVGWRDGRRWACVRPAQLNRWLAQRIPDASAKDFRSWHGTVLAAASLVLAQRSGCTREAAIPQMAREVALALGNTPAVARSAYVHPAVVDAWSGDRDIAPALDVVEGLGDVTRWDLRQVVERAVLDLLADLTPRTMRTHARELLES